MRISAPVKRSQGRYKFTIISFHIIVNLFWPRVEEGPETTKWQPQLLIDRKQSAVMLSSISFLFSFVEPSQPRESFKKNTPLKSGVLTGGI